MLVFALDAGSDTVTASEFYRCVINLLVNVVIPAAKLPEVPRRQKSLETGLVLSYATLPTRFAASGRLPGAGFVAACGVVMYVCSFF